METLLNHGIICLGVGFEVGMHDFCTLKHLDDELVKDFHDPPLNFYIAMPAGQCQVFLFSSFILNIGIACIHCFCLSGSDGIL